MITPLLLLSTLFGDIFYHYEIPLHSPQPLAIEVQSGYDSTRDLLVLDGHTLSLYEDLRQDSVTRIEIPANSTAFDFADLTGNGRMDIIVIAGRKVLRYDLTLPGEIKSEIFFECDSIFEDYSGAPFPQVLVVKKDNTPCLAIPTKDELLIYTAKGIILDRYPIGANAPYQITIGQPFQSLPLLQNRAAPAGALEITVQQTLSVKPELPAEWLPTTLPLPQQRLGTHEQALAASALKPEYWPWFPLRSTDARAERVLYALDAGEDLRTLIRFQRPATSNSTEAELSPIKEFPGHLLEIREKSFSSNKDNASTTVSSVPKFPDFNNDSYNDLITWLTPTPTPSLSTLTKMIGGGTWPLTLQVRLYDPKAGNFSTKANATIQLEVTLESLLMEGPRFPLRNIILDDLNGDKRCDIAFDLGGTRFFTWLYTPSGFLKSPDSLTDFTEPIREVLFSGPINDTGDCAIILRQDNKLQVLSHRKS